MINKHALRFTLVACMLAVAIAASHSAVLPEPVHGSLLRFTTSSTQTSVQVIISNPNAFCVSGNLTLVVVQPNGVPRTIPVGTIEIPSGNSFQRVIFPGAISGVRWVRVTNIQI